MHISEGVLNSQILITADIVSVVILVFSFKNLSQEKLLQSAVMAALFFIASFIHIPIGPTSTHLLMSGIVGLFLGSSAFVAIFVGLFLQALLFGYGGLSVLGVNLLIIATPALLARVFFKIRTKNQMLQNIFYFLSGSLPILASSFLLSVVLAFNDEAFTSVAMLSFASNIPVMIIEGLFVVFMIRYLQKVAPKILERV